MEWGGVGGGGRGVFVGCWVHVSGAVGVRWGSVWARCFSVFFVGLHSFFKAAFLFYIIEGSD